LNKSDLTGTLNLRNEEEEERAQKRKRTEETDGRLLMRNTVQRKTLSII
jgi:hypothetical protein